MHLIVSHTDRNSVQCLANSRTGPVHPKHEPIKRALKALGQTDLRRLLEPILFFAFYNVADIQDISLVVSSCY